MSNWYTTREAVKRAGKINGVLSDVQIDRIIETVSRQIDLSTRRFFLPRTETRLFRWPSTQTSLLTVLWLDQDLLSVTTLQSEAQNATPTTISSSDFFLEPNNQGPPYDRIEIDLSSTAAYQAGDTPQRSISVAGSWGYTSNTRSGGTVASGLDSDSAATTMVCSNASRIGVGDTLLIQSEQIFVSERDFAALDSKLINGALTSNQSEVTITVDSSHGIVAGEVIRIESEQMYVVSVATNDLTVIRAYNGSVLAAHSDDTAIHINRTLTIERGVNGTTAATHADATSITPYEPPMDIQSLCIGESLAMFAQEEAQWGRAVGPGDSARDFTTLDLAARKQRTVEYYSRVRMAVV